MMARVVWFGMGHHPVCVMLVCRVSTMIKAQGLISTREFGSAVTVLKSLDTKPLLRDNTDLLTTLGEAHFYNGDSTSACTTLQRVTIVYFAFYALPLQKF